MDPDPDSGKKGQSGQKNPDPKHWNVKSQMTKYFKQHLGKVINKSSSPNYLVLPFLKVTDFIIFK